MPNPTVPDFTELGARKLAELQANGYRITGYCFERQVDGTQPQRGFVDFAGFVGWWTADDRWGRRAHELHAAFGNAELPEFSGCVAIGNVGQDDLPQRQMQNKCWCTTCRPISGFGEDMRFVVCPTCGNKRCPHAHNHALACTNSNEPGQPGSSWEHVKPITAHGVADMKGGQDVE